MHIANALLVEPTLAIDRLQTLGLSRGLLHEIISVMVSARNSCTMYDAPATPGFYSWSAGVRRARELLVPSGWESCNDNNIASVCNKDLKIILLVTNTDGGTGLPDCLPQQTAKKGPGTERTVCDNQYLLEGILDTRSYKDGMVAWFLCVHHNRETVRAELVCPLDFDNGRFGSFSERILVFDSNQNRAEPVEIFEDEPIDIEITRKHN